MYELAEEQEQHEPIETLHVYVYAEEPQQPRWPPSPEARDRILSISTIIFLVCGIIALCLIPNEPAYTIQMVSVPARFLPVAHFSAASAIVPTGQRSYPSTTAKGVLTIYNGSIFTQALPAGFIVTGKDGVELVTDTSVSIPSGNPPSYGVATASAHAVKPGSQGNIPAYDINATYGSDIAIENLAAFHGGQDARTVAYATSDDTAKALASARLTLATQERQHSGLLAYPCHEQVTQKALLVMVACTCQYVSFTPPTGTRVLSAQVVGSKVLLQIKVTMPGYLKGLPDK